MRKGDAERIQLGLSVGHNLSDAGYSQSPYRLSENDLFWHRFLTVLEGQIIMAVLGYGCVSIGLQTAANQRLGLSQAGYCIKLDFWFADDGISGKV